MTFNPPEEWQEAAEKLSKDIVDFEKPFKVPELRQDIRDLKNAAKAKKIDLCCTL